MKKVLLPVLAAILLVFASPMVGVGQQVIGSFPYMDGGFEGQTAGALGTALSPTAWSRQNQSGASTTIVSTTPRTGVKYATITNVSTASRGLQSPQTATVANGPQPSTSYTIQYFIKNPSIASYTESINTNGTSNTNYGTATTVSANASWTKRTVTQTSASGANSAAGILVTARSASAVTFDIDDVVLYAGPADATPANSPGAVTVNNPTTTSLDVSWGAASGGVDGGGYVVVRYSSNPNADNDPNQNGIYAVGNTTTNGTGSLTGTVRYISAGTSFTDNVGLSSGTQYWYKVYTVDKAFNYSTETSGNGTTTSSGSPTLSAGSLSSGFGNQCINTTSSTVPTFTITGSDLTSADVTVSGNAVYTFATTLGGTYSNPLNITQSGCSGSSCYSPTVYVKFTPTAVSSYNGNITVGGGGASSVTTAVTGSGVNTGPAAASGSASAITTTTATVAGSYTAGCSAVTGYGIEWSTTNGFANGAGTAVSSSNQVAGSYTSALSSLTANTTYYFHANATDGTTPGYGSQGTFITYPTVPTSVTDGTITSSGFTVSWSQIAGTIENYEIEVHSNSGFTALVGSAYGTANNATSQVISGLASSTQYWYRIRSRNNSDTQVSAWVNGAASVTTLSGPLWDNPITDTDPSGANPYTNGQTVGSGNLTVSGIGRGSGIPAATASNRYAASGWNSGSLDANDYFSFTLTPSPGYQINFTNFIYTGQASGSGATSVSFRSSLDGYGSGIGTATVSGTTISLAGASYQNITSAITFRLYGWGASAAGGTFSVNDFQFNGTVTAALPTVSLSILPTSGSENTPGADITLTATSNTAVSGDQTVTIGLTGAAVAADFQSTPPTTITILNGQTVGNSSTFRVNDDALNEGSQTATFTITGITSGGTAAVIGTTDHVDFAITDNDAPIITTAGTPGAMSANVGTPSASETFTVSGDNLTGNLSLAALTGFAYSLDNSTFTSTLTVPVSGGNVTGEPRTIYVRLTGASVGSFSGNVVISGGGASSVNVAVSGTVIDPNAATELFISEYGEGSTGSSRYLEIYNGTGSSVDLANYRIELVTNGGTWYEGLVNGGTGLTGNTLVNGDVFVITHNSTDVPGGDLVTGTAAWNGNDALALSKFDGVSTWTRIDVIGTDGADPGNGWNVAGVTDATMDRQLVRKSHICGPNANWSSSAGTNTANSEWIVADYVTGAPATFGSHVACTLTLPKVNISLSASSGSENTPSANITLTVTASAAVVGNQTIKVSLSGTNVTTGDLTNFAAPVTVTILNGATTGTHVFQVNDDATTESLETATFTLFDRSSGIELGTTLTANLTITDNDIPASTASVIKTMGGEPVGISSLTNGTIVSNTDGVQVWHFRLHDGDGTTNDADALPTEYQGWTITPNANNTVPDWGAAIADRKFFVGASTTPLSGGGLTNPASILFPISSGSYISVGDNGYEDVYMRITLANPLPVGSDGKEFGFQIVPGGVTVNTGASYSQLGSFTASSADDKNVIQVNATLQFINAPPAVNVGNNFSISLNAIDANGNIDVNDNSSITLSLSTGSGTLSGTLTGTLTAGTITFSGLNYNLVEQIKITAVDNSAPTLPAITTNFINVVDEPHQLFDDFNRADGNSVGVPSSGGSTAWTEVASPLDDGSRQRISTGTLLLSNCNTSNGVGNQGMDQVIFDASNHYETQYDNAGSELDWLFNMKVNYGSTMTGFNSNTYGTAFILGSTTSSVQNANTKGYAVIFGNAGPATRSIKLVRFEGDGASNGLTNSTFTEIAASNATSTADFYSIKVVFDPCSDEWSLYVRSDGTSGFALPNSGTYGSAFTGTDFTHTSLDLKYFGAVWQHGGSCALTPEVVYDNFSIPNASTVSSTAKTWNGSVSANWNVAANWGPCPGVPTITDNVIIPNVATQPVVSATPAAVCKALTVNVGADLTINSGQNLTADGAVVNNGIIYVNNAANFIQTLNSTSYSGSGQTVVGRQGNGSGGYNAWSSPVVGAGIPGNNKYWYDSSAGTNSNADDVTPYVDPGWKTNVPAAMVAGVGYYSTDAGFTTFSGQAHNGSYTPSVITSGQPANSIVAPTYFNLIGNPYASSLNADLFISQNSGRIDGALYFWSDENAGAAAYSTDDFATYSTGGLVVPLTGGGSSGAPVPSIPSCQGFFVHCTSSGSINFNNGQRGGTNNQFFRLAETDHQRIWLSINNDALQLFNQTLVAFSADATDQKDWGVDALKMRGNSAIALASVQDEDTYVIATFADIPSNGKVVPLMTYVQTSGAYTFVADSMIGFEDRHVYLEDLSTGQLFPMQQGDSHTFHLSSNDEFNRFQLWFSPSTVTGLEESEDQLQFYATNDMIVVESASTEAMKGTLRIVDMAGRVILNQGMTISNSIGRTQVGSLATGIYAVSFIADNNEIQASEKMRLGN